MSLSTRVFVFFATLMVLMLGSQWYMMRAITNDVSSEMGKVAFSVAKDTASFFIFNDFQWFGGQVLEQRIQSNSRFVTKSDGSSEAVTIIQAPPPTVQIRINNQRTDDSIQLISGNEIVDIPLPREEMIAAVEALQTRMILSSLAILGIGLVLAAIVAKRLVRPVTELSEAALDLAKGNLGVQIKPKSGYITHEIQTSINTFNTMSNQLAVMQKENQALQANAHYKELGYISSGLAHSIRNPLNTLGLTIEQIVEPTLEKEQRNKLVSSAYRQIHRIDNWVKTFMTFALGSEATTEEVSLKSILVNISAEASQLRNDVTITFDMASDIRFEGIEAELHAMFHSLIINAVDASPENAEVKIMLNTDNGHCQCQIIDKGKGIPEARQAELFQPHKTTKSKGSGMGLYMAQKLVENRYNGTITLVSSNTEGTVIEINLDKKRQV